jgi:hypothetical protein
MTATTRRPVQWQKANDTVTNNNNNSVLSDHDHHEQQQQEEARAPVFQFIALRRRLGGESPRLQLGAICQESKIRRAATSRRGHRSGSS